MTLTRAYHQRPDACENDPSSPWETCADAAARMETILDELAEYGGVYEETCALRRQLARIQQVCQREAPPQPDGDPRRTAQALVARLPLEQVFQDKALADAFLSELLLALARESDRESRKCLQKQGIQQAKAQGVRFGAPSQPLPSNFEQARLDWRSGKLSTTEAAKQCGMARTTFYDAARRVEKARADG